LDIIVVGGVPQPFAVYRERGDAAMFVVHDNDAFSGHYGALGIFETVGRVQRPEQVTERGVNEHGTA